MPPVLALANTIDPAKFAIHRASSGHYFNALPDVATAQKYAALMDIIISNPNKFESFANAMSQANSSLILGEYDKSIQSDKAINFPEPYYAHSSTPISSTNRITVFNKYYEMLANGLATYNDPRNFSSGTWREWIAKDHWKNVAAVNGQNSNSPLNAVDLDSLSQSVGNPVDPATGAPFGQSAFTTISFTCGDECKNRKPAAGYWVVGNGLHDGPGYMGNSVTPANPSGSTQDLLPHLDVGIGENFMRSNGSPVTNFRTDRELEQNIDLCKSAAARSIGIWVVVNINNSTAGGSGFVATSCTNAQADQWRRYTMAAYLIGNDGLCWYEFVQAISVLPWNEDHAWYHLVLGAPIDNLVNGAAYKDGTTGLYTRNFANGTVFINNRTTDYTFNPGVNYKLIDGTPVTGTVTIPTHDALILLGPGTPTNTGGYTDVPVVVDTYTRTVAAGSLGTTDSGHTYTLTANVLTDLSVDGSRAVVNNVVARSRTAIVDTVVVGDGHAIMKFQWNEVPLGDDEVVNIWLKTDAATSNGYRLRCTWSVASGTMTMRLQKMVAGVAISIGSLRTAVGTPSIGTVWIAEMECIGESPTNLMASLYRELDGPPGAWMDSTSDNEATLQVTNRAVGWSTTVGSLNTNAPVNAYILDFNFNNLIPAPPPNVPPTLSALSPIDGTTLATVAGKSTRSVNFAATATDTDGTVADVTILLNNGTAQSMTSVSGQWKQTFVLSGGTYAITWTATDDKGATATATTTLVITVTPPDPTTTPTTGGGAPSIEATVEYVVIHTDHSGKALGEVRGIDLRFGKFIMQPGYCSYDVFQDNPMSQLIYSEPNKTDYAILRNGIEVATGEITSREADTDTNLISITGQDWMNYFDHLVLPFDPDNMKASDNFTRVTTDLTDITEALIAKVLAGYSNTVQITMNNAKTGLVQDQHMQATDLNTLKSMIDTLATQNPGFEWEITHDMQFIMYSPRRTDYSAYRIDAAVIQQIHYGLQGVPASTVYGRGSGSGSAQAIKRATNPSVTATYRDRVVVNDFGTVSTRAMLTQLTGKKLAELAKQKLEFWITIRPHLDDNIMALIQPGQYVYVDWNDGYIQLQGYYRCAGMEAFVNAQGDEEFTLNFNTDDTAA